jgi:hypothetical protein
MGSVTGALSERRAAGAASAPIIESSGAAGEIVAQRGGAWSTMVPAVVEFLGHTLRPHQRRVRLKTGAYSFILR